MQYEQSPIMQQAAGGNTATGGQSDPYSYEL